MTPTDKQAAVEAALDRFESAVMADNPLRKTMARLELRAILAEPRPCTCHPDDNPPVPCPRKYALSECRAAAPSPTPATVEACPNCFQPYKCRECHEKEIVASSPEPRGDEAVACWRVFDSSTWNDGLPTQQTIDYWRAQGVDIQYAYTRPNTSAEPRGLLDDVLRDAARYRRLRAALSDPSSNGRSHWFCSIKRGHPEELDVAIDAITHANEGMKG